MIPNNTVVAERTGELGGEKVEMGVSKKGLPYIMNLLTDLYSDQVMAVIREYSTNAWDSHIDAGKTHRPIEVTLPSNMSPYFVIRDFGIGMDAGTIRDIYAFYGESTKREQTTTNGSMGIGAKAALSYTTQFMVTGWKNGIKTLVSVGRNDDGTGVMEIVYQGPDDAETGVEIRVPVKRGSDFNVKASNFYRYWKPGMVLLNGVDPSASLVKISDRIFENPGAVTDLIVMGNVAYPLTSRSISAVAGVNVVCFVTMNGDDEVVFSPSRESLIYNDTTLKSIESLKVEYTAAIVKHLTEQVKSASTYADAFRTVMKIRSNYGYAVGNFNPEYKGIAINDSHLVSNHTDGNGGKVIAKFTKWYVGKSRYAVEHGSVHFSTVCEPSNAVVVNYRKTTTVSGSDKKRMKEYFSEQGKNSAMKWQYYNSSVVIFTSDSELPDPDRTAGIKVYDWKDILASTRAPHTSSRSGMSSNGQFSIIKRNGLSEYGNIDNEDVVYMSSADRISDHHIHSALRLFPNLLFVMENANRHGRIEKLAKSAVHWNTFYRNSMMPLLAKRDFDALTVDKLRATAYSEAYGSVGTVAAFGGNSTSMVPLRRAVIDGEVTIDDPDYRNGLIYSVPAPELGFARSDPRFKDAIKKHGPKKAEALASKYYPLINAYNIGKTKKIAEYINSEYAKRNGA